MSAQLARINYCLSRLDLKNLPRNPRKWIDQKQIIFFPQESPILKLGVWQCVLLEKTCFQD